LQFLVASEHQPAKQGAGETVDSKQVKEGATDGCHPRARPEDKHITVQKQHSNIRSGAQGRETCVKVA
jgi:hypothetical protein